jgi:uncharacterized protein YbjT (DUF2867 family)
MSEYTVTVTGASGKTGREVVRQAVQRGWRVRAASRRPASGRPVSGQPAEDGEWTSLDLDAPHTWEPAFAGSDAAYILTPFNHPRAVESTCKLIAAAAEAGAPRIVLLSSLDAENAPSDDPLRVIEATLQRQPVRWAVVRPTWFLDNFTTGSFAAMTAAGELRLPSGDGVVPFVDVRDVAAVAVAALGADGPEGVLPVTGPERIDHHRVAAALAAVLEHAVSYRSVPAEEFITLLAGRGFPRSYGEFLSDLLLDIASGRLDIPVADTVERVTGRPAYSVDDFARHYAATLT